MGKNSDKKLDNEFGPQAHLLTWEAAADLLIAFGSQIWIDGLRDRIIKSNKILMGFLHTSFWDKAHTLS